MASASITHSKIVRAAGRAGADAVKLQTYTPDTMTLDCRRGPFVLGPDSPWRAERSMISTRRR